MSVKRASPVAMRQALESVNAMRAAGLLFVPMPVLDEADGKVLLEQMMERLEKVTQEAEA